MNQLQQDICKFTEERGWTGNRDARSLAISVSLEASELLEHFQWRSTEEVLAAAGKREEIAEEAADVFIYLLQLADVLEVDLLDVARKKLEKNESRWPVG